jgi:hypothetical protein
MPQPPANGGTYQVHCSGAIANHLKQVQRRAKIEGRGPEVLSAIRRIWHSLSYDPLELGEPMYRLPGMHLEVRQVALGPLLIYFAVHDQRPLVFIKGAALLPKHNA